MDFFVQIKLLFYTQVFFYFEFFVQFSSFSKKVKILLVWFFKTYFEIWTVPLNLKIHLIWLLVLNIKAPDLEHQAPDLTFPCLLLPNRNFYVVFLFHLINNINEILKRPPAWSNQTPPMRYN